MCIEVHSICVYAHVYKPIVCLYGNVCDRLKGRHIGSYIFFLAGHVCKSFEDHLVRHWLHLVLYMPPLLLPPFPSPSLPSSSCSPASFSPPLSSLLLFEDRILLNCPDWPPVCNPPTSSSWVPEVISMHRHSPLGHVADCNRFCLKLSLMGPGKYEHSG